MKKIKFIIIITVIISQNVSAQFAQETFFNRVSSIYHTLNETALKNFSSWIVSDHFELNTAGFFGDQEFYPVEFVWVNPNRIFFIRKALPAIEDSAKRNFATELQTEMQQELKGILLDWQRFNGQNIINDLPSDYNLEVLGDTVFVFYESGEGGQTSKSIYYFGLNGICFRVKTLYTAENKKIVLFPNYLLLGNKWLCTGWSVQIFKNNSVESGYEVSIKSQKYDSIWLPVGISLKVQTAEKMNQTFTRLYKFRNILTNRDFKILDK